MKTRIEKRGAGRKQPEPENGTQDEFDVKALLAALPKSDPPRGISGDELLKRMGTFDFDPEFFKEFEELQEKMRQLYSQPAEE